jgi:hypothetical protein
MHDESEMHQLMLERMQMLEEALERAEAGIASGGDWDIIRSECGLPKRPIVTLETVSIGSELWR